MNEQSITRYYQHTILPALFERLDQAFPEFCWHCTALGWNGIRDQDDGMPGESVICHHPWGFVDEHGAATSWLCYEVAASQCSPIEAMRHLATRAGVDVGYGPHSSRPYGNSEIAELRRQDLLEHFAAYCNFQLHSPHGRESLDALQAHYGVDTNHIRQLGVGLYTSSQEVGEHLVRAGFSHDEIIASAVVGDTRVPGRLIVPWRDRDGQIKTIIARDLAGAQEENLYLKGGTRTAAFGLDVALRPAAGGRNHLVIVEDALDVVYFQSIGVLNVAAITDCDEAITGWHWERLARSGVRSVTLAVSGNGHHREEITHAIKATHHVERSPQVYSLTAEALADCDTAADFVRQYGLPEFENVLKQREHGYCLVAKSIVDKYRQGTTWSDVQLLNMLGEAVRFDAEVDDVFRVEQLKEHYWPAIVQATELPWEALQNLLKRREEPKQLPDLGGWQVRNLKQLVRDLRHCLRIEDYETFKKLICDAARDFGGSIADPSQESIHADSFWIAETSHDEQEHLISLGEAVTKFPLINVATIDEDSDHLEPATVSLADVRQLAYQLWEQNGRPSGEDRRFWHEAEQALASHTQSEPPKLRVAA